MAAMRVTVATVVAAVPAASEQMAAAGEQADSVETAARLVSMELVVRAALVGMAVWAVQAAQLGLIRPLNQREQAVGADMPAMPAPAAVA
jgi:hypothetical protein